MGLGALFVALFNTTSRRPSVLSQWAEFEWVKMVEADWTQWGPPDGGPHAFLLPFVTALVWGVRLPTHPARFEDEWTFGGCPACRRSSSCLVSGTLAVSALLSGSQVASVLAGLAGVLAVLAGVLAVLAVAAWALSTTPTTPVVVLGLLGSAAVAFTTVVAGAASHLFDD